MKKQLSVFLAGILLLSLTACAKEPGNKAAYDPDEESTVSTSEKGEDATTEDSDRTGISGTSSDSTAAQSVAPGGSTTESGHNTAATGTTSHTSAVSGKTTHTTKTTSVEDTGEKPDDRIPRVDLSEGKFYTVTGGTVQYDNYSDYSRSSGCLYKLTDGVIPDKGSRNTTAAYSGSSDYVVDLELGSVCWVYTASMGFYGGSWNAKSPETLSVEFFTYADGKYQSLGKSVVKNKKTSGIWTYCDHALNHKPVKTSMLRVKIHTENAKKIIATELTVTGYSAEEELDTDDVVRVDIRTGGKAIVREDYIDCTVQVHDPSGRYSDITDSKASVKIRGNSTAEGAKKPYNIKFDKKQDVLGMGKCKKWCLLANMYDKTLIRNKMIYDFAGTTSLKSSSQSVFCDVYLNDTYQGSYQLCESVGVGDSRVDIDIENHEYLLELESETRPNNPVRFSTPVYAIRLGYNDPEEPTDEQKNWLLAFLKTAEQALQSGDQSRIAQYFDIDSFADDYLVHEYFKCVDTLNVSTRFYVKDSKIYAGPVWDFDLSTGNANPAQYTTYYNSYGTSEEGWWCRGLWFAPLLKTDWFTTRCKQRFAALQPRIVNLYMSNELGESWISSVTTAYRNSFKKNYTVWNVDERNVLWEGDPRWTYEEHILALRGWLYARNNWMKSQWGIH